MKNENKEITEQQREDSKNLIEMYGNKKAVDSAAKKASILDFVSTDSTRYFMNGIFYEKGFAIATDGRVLIKQKMNYPAEYEGKIVNPKDGTFIDGEFPKYEKVFSDKVDLIDRSSRLAHISGYLSNATAAVALTEKTRHGGKSFVPVVFENTVVNPKYLQTALLYARDRGFNKVLQPDVYEIKDYTDENGNTVERFYNSEEKSDDKRFEHKYYTFSELPGEVKNSITKDKNNYEKYWFKEINGTTWYFGTVKEKIKIEDKNILLNKVIEFDAPDGSSILVMPMNEPSPDRTYIDNDGILHNYEENTFVRTKLLGKGEDFYKNIVKTILKNTEYKDADVNVIFERNLKIAESKMSEVVFPKDKKDCLLYATTLTYADAIGENIDKNNLIFAEGQNSATLEQFAFSMRLKTFEDIIKKPESLFLHKDDLSPEKFLKYAMDKKIVIENEQPSLSQELESVEVTEPSVDKEEKITDNVEYVSEIEKIGQVFSSKYEELYNDTSKESLETQKEAMSQFDKQMETNETFKRFVNDFVKERGDFLSSDREEAAMILAIKELNLEQKLGIALKEISQEKTVEENKFEIKDFQENLKDVLSENAENLQTISFTQENYNILFNRGIVQTPLECVKLGEHQFEKLEAKSREKLLFATYQTLTTPDFILEENKENKKSHNYVKSFIFDEKTRAVQDIVVNIEDENVSISSHERSISNVINKIKNPDQILYIESEIGNLLKQRELDKNQAVDSRADNGKELNSIPLNKEYNRNSLLSIKKLETHLSQKGKNEESKTLPFSIINNKNKGRVNIKFDTTYDNPDFQKIIKELKSNGWKYAPSTKQWYPVGKAVEKAADFAVKLQKCFSDKKEEYKESSVYDGIRFFDRNYNESQELTKYLNRTLNPHITLKESSLILEALEHDNSDTIENRNERLGLNKENKLVVLSRKDEKVELKELKDEKHLLNYALVKSINDLEGIKELQQKNLETGNAAVIDFMAPIYERTIERKEEVVKEMTSLTESLFGEKTYSRDMSSVSDNIEPENLIHLSFKRGEDAKLLEDYAHEHDNAVLQKYAYISGYNKKPAEIMLKSVETLGYEIYVTPESKQLYLYDEQDKEKPYTEYDLPSLFELAKNENVLFKEEIEVINEAEKIYTKSFNFAKEKIPYVEIPFSENSKFKNDCGGVISLSEFNEKLLETEKIMNKNETFFSEGLSKYEVSNGDAYGKYADAREKGTLTSEQEYGFGSYKTDVVLHLFDGTPEIMTYSMTIDLGRIHSSILDYVKETCSYSEVQNAINATEDRLYYSSVTEEIKTEIAKIRDTVAKDFEVSCEADMNELKELRDNQKSLRSAWIANASDISNADKELEKIQKQFAETCKDFGKEFYKKIDFELLQESSGINKVTLNNYILKEIKNMIIEQTHKDSRKEYTKNVKEKFDYALWHDVMKFIPENTEELEKFIQDAVKEPEIQVEHIKEEKQNRVIYSRTSYRGWEFSPKKDFSISSYIRPFDQSDRSGFILMTGLEGKNGFWNEKVNKELLHSEGWSKKGALYKALETLSISPLTRDLLSLKPEQTFKDMVSEYSVINADTGEDVRKEILPDELLRELSLNEKQPEPNPHGVAEEIKRIENNKALWRENHKSVNEGDTIGEDAVSEVLKLSDGVFEAVLSRDMGGAGAAANYLVINKAVASKCNKNIIALAKETDGLLVFENKAAEAYIRKELIDKKLCPLPLNNADYYERLSDYVENHPLKYISLLANTAFNFENNLKKMLEIEPEQKDILTIGKKLISMASSEEQKRIGQKILESGGKDEASMKKLFEKWSTHGIEQEKSKKKDGYPPRGES